MLRNSNNFPDKNSLSKSSLLTIKLFTTIKLLFNKNSNCSEGFKFSGTITSYATKSMSFIISSSSLFIFFLFTNPLIKLREFFEFLYFPKYFDLNNSSLIINSPLTTISLFDGRFKNGIK